METWPNHITDLFVQVDWHSGIFLGLVPPNPIPLQGQSFHISAGGHIIPEVSPGRFGTSKSNKWSVLADYVPVISRGHECANVVFPHLNVDFIIRINVLAPFLILGSSTKCEFAVGSVRCDDGPIAVSLFKALGFDWSCQDVSFGYKIGEKAVGSLGFYAPTCLVVNSNSTIIIGFTWGDLVASLVCALFDSALQMVMSFLFNRLVGFVADSSLFKGLFKSQTMALLRGVDLPRTFNERIGEGFLNSVLGKGSVRFSSMAEALDESVLRSVFDIHVGGEITSKVSDMFQVTGEGGLADWLGAHVDRNAELLDR